MLRSRASSPNAICGYGSQTRSLRPPTCSLQFRSLQRPLSASASTSWSPALPGFARSRFGPSDTHCRPESQEPEAFAPWRTRCIFAQSRSWPGEPEPFSSSADLLAADSEFTTPTVGLGLDLFASSRRPLSALAFGPALYTRRRTLRAGRSALDHRNRSPTTAVGTLPAWTRRSLPGRVQRARPPEVRILAERAPRRRP